MPTPDRSVDVMIVGMLGTVIGLFAWVIRYVMRENSRREKEYQSIIKHNQEHMAKQQETILALAEKYEEIKVIVMRLLARVEG